MDFGSRTTLNIGSQLASDPALLSTRDRRILFRVTIRFDRFTVSADQRRSLDVATIEVRCVTFSGDFIGLEDRALRKLRADLRRLGAVERDRRAQRARPRG